MTTKEDAMRLQGNAAFPDDFPGTWKLRITRAGLPPFFALHVYFADGTMMETTSEWGKGIEGPGLGAWERTGAGFAAMFELFLFSDCGDYAGMARVRSTIEVAGPDRLTGQAVVDLIGLDGGIQPGVVVSLFEGTRIKVLPAGR